MIILYKTKPGDTIFKLLEQNNASFKEFEKMNDILNLKFIKHQMVLIPLSHNTSVQLYAYETKESDTLNQLINTYQVTYEEIKYFNNLFHLILTENQKIEIENKVISPVAKEFEID